MLFNNPYCKRLLLFIPILFFNLVVFSQTTIDFEDFESGWGIWNDGGGDCSRETTGTPNGTDEIRIKDNSGASSSMTTDNMDFTSFYSVEISFDYESSFFDDSNDDFFVRYSNNGGVSWTTIATYVYGTDFNNGIEENPVITIDTGSFTFTNQSQFRIQCDAGNYDYLFIDNVLILGYSISGPEINIKDNDGTNISNGDNSPSIAESTDFGNVDVTSGFVSHTFIIENIGTTNLTLNNPSPYVVLTGDTADFTLTANPSTPISPSGSTSFTITFDPTSIGVKSATVSIANNDSNEDPYTFDIEGVGTTITYSEVTVSVTWPSWSSENRVEVYSPSGTLITTIDNGYAGGVDNSYGPITFNLGCLQDLPNYYFIMYDTYDDGWNGTDNITITSSGVNVINQNGNAASSGGTTVYFDVSGGICGGDINVLGNGTSINDGETVTSYGNHTLFGNIDVGSSFTRTFTIQNTGGADLTIGATVNLATGTAFSVSTQPAITLLTSSASTTFVITFTPSSTGTFSDVVTITSDDSDENPFTFTISGNGTTPLTEGPGGVTNNLALWLKADANVTVNGSNGVTVWGDNGRGSDAVVNTTGQEPTLRDNATNNINFNPVVDFDNDRNNAPEEYNYAYTPQEYLQGSSGFYTQEIFIVALPNDAVDNTYASMDLFCGDSPLVISTEDDGTGVGFGRYSQRWDDEALSFAIGTTNDTSNPVNTRGYGNANTTGTFNAVGIINVRDNINSPVNGAQLYYNGNNVAESEVGVPQFINVEDSRYWIGRSQGYRASYEGRVTEIITYSSRQNDANLTQERNRIQSYLAIKYGITLGVNGTSQDYVDSNGTVIWDQSANSGFSYDIAGIGRDDDSGLNQKQSKSVNPTSVVTIGYGDIAATNSANTNNFTADRDFLVWGHNNAALSGSDVLSINLGASATSVTTMFDRRWKIVESRPTGGNDILDVKVSIPNAILPSISANEEYALIVSSTATFGSGDIVDVIPLKANGSNFETWYDFDNTKYFTFGIATRVTGKYNVEFSTGDFLVGENTVNLNSNFTVSAWVRNLGNGGTYVSKGTAYDFKLNTSGNVEVYTNGTLRATSTETINDAIWHHIAITNNGSNLLIYIDGVLDTTSASVSPSATTDKFAIGVVYTTKNNISTPFHGDIDEIRIWDTVLTQAQIQYIMNQEIEDDSNNVNGTILPQTVTLNAVSSIPWNTIKAYHNINSFYGTTVEDASNNNNHVRIKYLTIGKDIIDNQSAPLPYISSSNGNWDTSGTWTNGSELYIPNTAGLDGTIINWNIVETNTNVNTTRDVTVLGLVNSLNELSINADNKLEVSHYLKIDGVIDLDGESQLIQTTDSDFDTSSTGNLERDQQGVGNKFRYNDWSSPVSSNASTSTYTVASVLKDGTDANNPININFVGGYNGDNTTTPIQIANYWIYKYANDDHDNYSKWNQIGSTGPLKAGEGYLMKGTANPGVLTDQNYVFVGKPNNGDISLTVAPTNDYLVGNPYPSAIDADAFIIDNVNSIEGGTIYFWEHYGGDSHNLKDYQAGYASYNLSGGVIATSHPINDPLAGPGSKEPQQFIAVGQGFFVQGDADGGDIVFKNSQRAFVTEANPLNSIFLKTSQTKKGETSIEKKGDTRLKIKLALESNSSMRRQLLLTIDERASDAIDWGFDGPIYEEFSEDMYWPIENGKYVIQGTNNLTKDKEIPLAIKSVGGLITIKIDAIENAPENFEVYIKDTTTGETYDILKAGLEIELEAGVYSDKFVITFQPRLKTIDEITLNEGVHIFMNNTTSELQINKILDTQITDVVLYNYLGQTVKTWNTNFEERLTSLPLNMATGAYIVNVNTIDGTITKKIIIN